MPSYGTPHPSAYKQTCVKCGETVQREADWEPLDRCPRCATRFPRPVTFAPASGTLGIKGAR